MKVALFVQGFPEPSQTFVLRQVTGLLAAGVDVRILSVGAEGDWGALPAALAAELRPRVMMTLPPAARAVSPQRMALALALRAPFDRAARLRLRALLAARRIGEPYTLAADIALAGQSVAGERFDAILAHFGPSGVRAAGLRRAGLIAGPIATVFHGYDVSRTALVKRLLPAYRALFAETELLLPISERWAARLREWGAPADKIRILHMGVDLPEAEPDWRRPLGRPLRALAAGRFTEKKGLRHAIEGVRRCPLPVTLDIAGAGELEPELRAAAEGSANPIRFLGLIPHAALLDRMAQADVLLLPSVEAGDGDLEGIPVTLMEAMARGCLVVSTRHSGIPELVEDGVSGLLADERSSDQVADALTRIASGGIDVEAMRRAAWRAVADGFDNRRLDTELLALLRALGGAGSRSRA